MEAGAAGSLSEIAPILVLLGYAAIFHFLYWSRGRYAWTERTVGWLGRVTKQGEEIVLIWALLADMLAAVFIVTWLARGR